MSKQQNIIEKKITNTLEENYMPYAMSVIVSRAIPEIDGFKPSHRKLLYTMYKMGLLTGGKTKSANVVGQTMKLNPHGDGAIYETLVRLTRGNEALLHPFIDSKGNFGKQYSRDMAYAAPRYTEVKLDSICNEIFKDIDKNTVDFIDNYDGTMTEPMLLPTIFPNVLVNPNQGIAVGMASSICSFNLMEICEATIQLMKNENTDMTKYLKAPDFSSGGFLLYNPKDIEQIYRTGKGSFKLRAKYHFDKKNSCIEITEIPYTTTTEAIIDKIIDLVKSGKIKEINDLRDETDLDGLKLTIDIKKAVDPDLLMNKLFMLTPLQDSFHCNFNILVDGKPQVLGIVGILKAWISFRFGCIRRQISHDIQKKTEKLHVLKGLEKILLNIDKAISIIRHTEEEKLVIPNLMKGFQIDEIQAEYIADIKLRNLNKEYLLKRTGEIDQLTAELQDLQSTLADDGKVQKIIAKQLRDISKQYGKPRKTEILQEAHLEEIKEEHFIEDYNIKLFLTADNYFKKISFISLRSASDQKLKENDYIVQEVETSNKVDILFFSDKCNVYKLRAYELEDCKASSLGEYLPNLLDLAPNEKILYLASTTDYEGFMIFGFENGKVAKVDLHSYETKTNRKKLVNAYYDKSKLIFLACLLEDTDLVAIRDKDKALLFSTALLTSKASKNTAGVQVYLLKKNSIMTQIFQKEDFAAEDLGYYRTDKIPFSGRFVKDKELPKTTAQQLKLY